MNYVTLIFLFFAFVTMTIVAVCIDACRRRLVDWSRELKERCNDLSSELGLESMKNIALENERDDLLSENSAKRGRIAELQRTNQALLDGIQHHAFAVVNAEREAKELRTKLDKFDHRNRKRNKDGRFVGERQSTSIIQLTPEHYRTIADNVAVQIAGKVFPDIEVEMHASEFSGLLKLRAVVYYNEETCGSGQPLREVKKVVPIWWEFTTTTDDGNVENNFSFNELEPYIYQSAGL